MDSFVNIILIAWLTIGEGSPAEPALHVAIIWRREHNHIKYEWLPHTWSGAKSSEWNETRDHLESTIQRLLRSSGALSREAVIKVRFVLFINVLIAECC
jgi:DnaJ family protein C protein 16